jgi:hypothetical protein
MRRFAKRVGRSLFEPSDCNWNREPMFGRAPDLESKRERSCATCALGARRPCIVRRPMPRRSSSNSFRTLGRTVKPATNRAPHHSLGPASICDRQQSCPCWPMGTTGFLYFKSRDLTATTGLVGEMAWIGIWLEITCPCLRHWSSLRLIVAWIEWPAGGTGYRDVKQVELHSDGDALPRAILGPVKAITTTEVPTG